MSQSILFSKQNNKYILMHKEVKVAVIEISPTGHISKIEEILNKEHFPHLIWMEHDKKLEQWWIRRGIPMSRHNVKDLIFEMGISDTSELIMKCMGLSLSDHYWIQEIDKNMKYSEINFFENSFSDDIGKFLMSSDYYTGGSFLDPAITSDGEIPKRWKIINNKRVLLKSSNEIKQQPYNEVIATKLCETLNIPHINYSLEMVGNQPISLCENMLDINTEILPAYSIITSKQPREDLDLLRQYSDTCLEYNLDIKQDIYDALLVDFILGNTDRHMYNFGVIRNANTLKWLRHTPIFDTGNCLAYNELTEFIVVDKDCKSKPFKNYHSQQLELISYSKERIRNIVGFEDVVPEIMQSYPSKDRISKIQSMLKTRINKLLDS